MWALKLVPLPHPHSNCTFTALVPLQQGVAIAAGTGLSEQVGKVAQRLERGLSFLSVAGSCPRHPGGLGRAGRGWGEPAEHQVRGGG